MKRILVRMQGRQKSRCFFKWRKVSYKTGLDWRHKRTVEYTLKVMFRQFGHRYVRLAWQQWEAVDALEKRHRHLIEKMILKMEHLELLAAFDSWNGFAHDARAHETEEQSVARATRFMYKHIQRRVFGGWAKLGAVGREARRRTPAARLDSRGRDRARLEGAKSSMRGSDNTT